MFFQWSIFVTLFLFIQHNRVITMVFKGGSSKYIQSLSSNFLTELLEITIELKIHNVQIIDNDFNGINNLCFCNPFVILRVFLHL